MKRVRAVALYLNVTMHKQHHGLSELAAVNELESNDLILFVNKKLTAYKAMVSPEVVVYYRSPGDRLTLNDFKRLPELFGGDRLVLSREVERELMDILKVKLKAVGT
jgi:hypothetical protein